MSQADPHALEVLYDRHAPAMFGLALRILQDAEEAETVVQAVFADAWPLVQETDDDREPPASRLLAATRRRAVERLRSRSATAAEDPAVVEPPLPAVADQRAPLAAEAVPRLRAALADLPFIERAAIELAAFEGMTAAQIAERLEQPPRTVRTRIRTGLLTLRETLTA